MRSSPKIRTHFSLEVFWEITQTPKSKILFFHHWFCEEFTQNPIAFFIRGFLGNHPNSEIQNPFFSSLVLWGVHPKSESLFSLEVLWAIHPNSEIGNPFFFSRGFLGREFTQTPKSFFIRCFLEGSPKIRNPIIIRGFLGSSPEIRNPRFLGNISPELRNLNST